MHPFIIYHGAVSPQGIRNLETLCSATVKEGATEITLCLSSGGGDVNAGLGGYHFLRMLPIKVNTHCFGVVGSIAATLYLAGENRTAAEASMFSLHAASYIEGPLQGQVSPNTQAISLPFSKQLGWTGERIDHFFSTADEKVFPAQEAVSLGIVQCLEELRFPAGTNVIHVNLS